MAVAVDVEVRPVVKADCLCGFRPPDDNRTSSSRAVAMATWTCWSAACECPSGSRRRAAQANDPAVSGDAPERVVAPMPGKVVKLLVKPGDQVTSRQGVIVVEAMKTENELRAGRDGAAVRCASTGGTSVSDPLRDPAPGDYVSDDAAQTP